MPGVINMRTDGNACGRAWGLYKTQESALKVDYGRKIPAELEAYSKSH